MDRPLIALSAVIGVVAAAVPVPKNAEKPNLYFPAMVGAKWVYKHSDGGLETRTVTEVEDKDGGKVVSVGDVEENGKVRHRMTVKVAATGVYVVGTEGADWDPPLCLVRLPHKDGAKWEASVTKKEKKTGFKSTTRHRLAAFGPEEVKVPAGTFMCIRVEESDNGANLESTSWYAPGVGLVKVSRITMSTVKDVPKRVEMVLMSFSPGAIRGINTSKKHSK